MGTWPRQAFKKSVLLGELYIPLLSGLSSPKMQSFSLYWMRPSKIPQDPWCTGPIPLLYASLSITQNSFYSNLMLLFLRLNNSFFKNSSKSIFLRPSHSWIYHLNTLQFVCIPYNWVTYNPGCQGVLVYACFPGLIITQNPFNLEVSWLTNIIYGLPTFDWTECSI